MTSINTSQPSLYINNLGDGIMFQGHVIKLKVRRVVRIWDKL